MGSAVRVFIVLMCLASSGTWAQIHPQQVHLALTDEPDAMAVSWLTIEASPESIVEYGIVPPEVTTAVLNIDQVAILNVLAPSSNVTGGKEPETGVGRSISNLGDQPHELEASETIRVGSKANANAKEQPEVKADVEEEREDGAAEVPLLTVNRSVGKSFSMIPGVFDMFFRFIHRVKLSGLEPNQYYWYRCGGPTFGWTRNYTFKTLPAGTDWSPKLAVYGDLGYVNGKILKHLIKHTDEGTIDAVVHTGDIGYDLHLEEGKIGDRFMDMIEPVASKVPYMVTPGNHESFRNFTNYKTRFWMPGDHENMMYTFTIGPVRVISVSTEAYYFFEYGGVQPITWQYSWLEGVLKEANRPENRRRHPWIILSGHRPMYCSNNILRTCSTGNTRVRDGGSLGKGKGLEKLLYDHGVDLAFWGHQHSYERLWPVYEKEIYNGSLSEPYVNPRAPIHFIVGCAGNNELRHQFLRTPPKWSAFRSLIFGFAHLTVANRSHLRVQYQSHDPKSPLVDEVWVVKDAHGPFPRLFPLDGRSRVKLVQKNQSATKRRKVKTFG